MHQDDEYTRLRQLIDELAEVALHGQVIMERIQKALRELAERRPAPVLQLVRDEDG